MALRFKNTATRETLEKYKRGEEQFEDALKRFQEEEKKEKEGQEEKAVEEYIVEFIEKLENFLRFKNPFTNFLKRWYSNFDNIMNLVDSTVYYRGLDFVLVFIIVTFWFCLDSAAEHYLHNDVALSALRDQHFYHLGHHPKGMFRMPASFWFYLTTHFIHDQEYSVYYGAIFLKGVNLAWLYAVTSIEYRRLKCLHYEVSNVDADIRLCIYVSLVFRIFFWWVFVVTLFLICPSSSNAASCLG